MENTKTGIKVESHTNNEEISGGKIQIKEHMQKIRT